LTGPAASVFLPSYNKAAYVGDAITSVLGQTFGDFEFWILENSDDGGATRAAIAPHLADPRVIYEEIGFTAEERAERYVTAVLLNRYYPKAAGRVIFYISDDDLMQPECVARCMEELGGDPGKSVVWFTMWRTAWSQRQGRFRPAGSIPAVRAVGVGTGQPQADCRIDGGQVAHRRECLDQLEQPFFPEERPTAHHADGVFLQKLANRYVFHPVPDYLMTHRVTPVSTWDRP
jgi:glycosyltransferase involved in cell wall biosynthesis